MTATKFYNGMDAQSNNILNVLDPTLAQHAATKNYVDNFIHGLDWHPHCRVEVATNVTLTAPGATLDSVTMAAGDRVMLTGQTTASQNGPWVYATASTTMTRPTDWAAAAVITNPGATFAITEGTANKDTTWTIAQSPEGSVTVDTTSTTWVQTNAGSSYTWGNGLQNSSGTISIKLNGSSLLLSGSGLSATPASIGATTKFAADSAALTAGTPATVTHSLGTTDVVCQVNLKSTGEEVDLGVIVTGSNTITVQSAASQSAAAFRIVVIA